MVAPPPSEDARELVRVVRMCKEFNLGTRVLEVVRDVDLTLCEGEMVTIMGASGAGKSTLLHCLGTLDLPTRGNVIFGTGADEVDVTKLSPADLADFRNRTIGFVFQFHHLLPEFSALENVMMPALIGRLPPREARKRAEDLLDDVGMSARLKHRPGELSGGEQQRVAIARALIMRPRLLLADEPTGNLDTKTSLDVQDLLFRLNKAHNLTILIVTHSNELAGKMPRVVRMADGQIMSDETKTLDPRGDGAAASDTTASVESAATPE